MKNILFLCAIAFLSTSVCGAEREKIVLQQGVSPAKDYAGCQTATLWQTAPSTAPAPGDQCVYLRGETNRMLLKFDLPELKEKKLARARLFVFLPKAAGENRYCEILCAGLRQAWDKTATWAQASSSAKWKFPGGDFDNQTNYKNGRSFGVSDSYELYAHDHDYWRNMMAFLPVGVPEGGLWISFNVTPLAEKWLADSAQNFGVMLSCTHADRRMPNPWEIDIPSEKFAKDATLRPKLELEFANANADTVDVGMIDTMTKINPWSSRFMYRGEYRRDYRVEMAANAREGFQVVVYPWMWDLSEVKFEWDDLTDKATGKKLPKDSMVWHCEDVVQLADNWLVRDLYFGEKRYWVPDALVPANLCPNKWRAVSRQQAKPFWFSVHAPAGTPAGDYETAVKLTATGSDPVEMKLTVRVWDFEIPQKWNFSVTGSFGVGAIHEFYGQDFKQEWLDQWYDFLIDHRLAPTEEYSTALSPPVDRLKHCFDRGINVLYLHGNFSHSSNLEELTARQKTVKEMGYADDAVIYVEDEGQQFEMRKAFARNIRKSAPEIPMMVGGAPPDPQMIGYIDVWDPEIDGWPADKLSAKDARKVVEACQARGEKFFWYVAAAPNFPYPNVQMEYPSIAGRSYLWMSWKYRVTGFEYYCYNLWGKNVRKSGPRWPEIAWDPRSFKEYNGDGCLYYPGPNGTPCSSIRLENIRDGVEDWETFYLLRDYADALRTKNSTDALLANADAMLDVPDEVVTSVTKWSQDPKLLLSTRSKLAELIVAIKKRVTQAEYEKVRDGRRQETVERQRKMLKERAATPEK